MVYIGEGMPVVLKLSIYQLPRFILDPRGILHIFL